MDDGDDSPGVPEWVVTYGDMMSLLLTFFIMLVSLSEVIADQKYRSVLDSLQKYLGYQSGPVSPEGDQFPLNDLIEKLDTLGSHSDQGGRGGVKVEGLQGSQLRVYRNREGKAVRIGAPIPFAPEETEPLPSGLKTLAGIATELAGKPNKIDITAHATPPAEDLSEAHRQLTVLTYRRAKAVLRFLEENGIDPARMRITAMADAEPLPDSGDIESLHNDRVDVLMLDAHASDFVGPRETPE